MNKDHGIHRIVVCEGPHGGCEASGSRWTVVDIVVKRGPFSSVWVWVCHSGFDFKYCEVGFEFKLCICVSCNCETTLGW